jgi:hypothetical protein
LRAFQNPTGFDIAQGLERGAAQSDGEAFPKKRVAAGTE